MNLNADCLKFLIYLTPDGRLTQTSDENNYCPCISISYDILSIVCKKISSKATGQGQVFLSILQNYIDKQTNNKLMNKEAIQLIRKLYSDNNYRQAIKLLSQYTPNTKTVFDEVIVIVPVATVQVGCVTLAVGASGNTFGAAIPFPIALVQPFTVLVTV